jgi:hypothetical protein
MTRKGAPFHGETGEGKTAKSAKSSHRPDGLWACKSTTEKSKTKDAHMICANPVAAAASGRAGSN